HGWLMLIASNYFANFYSSDPKKGAAKRIPMQIPVHMLTLPINLQNIEIHFINFDIDVGLLNSLHDKLESSAMLLLRCLLFTQNVMTKMIQRHNGHLQAFTQRNHIFTIIEHRVKRSRV
ncbi:hypothetical protein ACJX0J_029653, partial [Zea mays]